MKNSVLAILISIVIFFFVVLPLFVVSPGAAVAVWIFDIVLFLMGYATRQNEIKAERIRYRAQLEEEGRRRVRQDYPSAQPIIIQAPPAQTSTHTEVTREIVKVRCKHCNYLNFETANRCTNCGASL